METEDLFGETSWFSCSCYKLIPLYYSVWCSVVYMHCSFFFLNKHSPIEGYLCFHFETIMNKADINIWVQVFGWKVLFLSEKYLKSTIPGLYGDCIFSVTIDYQAAFQNGSAIFHSNQQCMNFTTSLPAFGVFSVLAIIIDMQWYLKF